jgi:pyruvate decarboxylase
MKAVLKKVTERLPKLNVQPGPRMPDNVIPLKHKKSSDPAITHDWLWPRVGQWLQKDDILITETGTANFGVWETRFPEGVTALSQVLWGSIGYSVGACQGAALAAKETGNRRTILFVGDGSFQLTAQEVSTMVRHDLKPIIFCICNDGYTIERYIHGMDATYNDIQTWNYRDLVPAFGAQDGHYKTFQTRTKDELDALFHDQEFSSAPYLQFVELYMPREDAPPALKTTAEASARNNAKA